MKTGKEPAEQIYSSWKIGIIECTQIDFTYTQNKWAPFCLMFI